jgi:hypothetical protein
MKKHELSLTIMVVFSSMLCVIPSLQADLIANEDFSNGLSGWSTTGNVISTDYANIPLQYKNNWDLSSWNNKMDGTFALLTSGVMSETIIGYAAGSDKLSLTIDYAIAWEKLNPNYGYGYLYVQLYGVTDSGSNKHLLYTEEAWGYTANDREKGVDNGTIDAQIVTLDHGLNYTNFYLDLTVINANQTLNQIVGIDNVNFKATPVPEPSSILLIALGLVGLIGLRRKFQR